MWAETWAGVSVDGPSSPHHNIHQQSLYCHENNMFHGLTEAGRDLCDSLKTLLSFFFITLDFEQNKGDNRSKQYSRHVLWEVIS